MPSPPPITLKRTKGRWFVKPDPLATRYHQNNAMHTPNANSVKTKTNMKPSKKDSPFLSRSQVVTFFRLLLDSLV